MKFPISAIAKMSTFVSNFESIETVELWLATMLHPNFECVQFDYEGMKHQVYTTDDYSYTDGIYSTQIS